MRNLFFILLTISVLSCSIDKGREMSFNQDLSGIVTNKYSLKWDHNTASISTNKIPEIAIDRWCHNNNLLENIQIGDSIYKPSGTLDFWLIKPNGDKFLYKHYD